MLIGSTICGGTGVEVGKGDLTMYSGILDVYGGFLMLLEFEVVDISCE